MPHGAAFSDDELLNAISRRSPADSCSKLSLSRAKQLSEDLPPNCSFFMISSLDHPVQAGEKKQQPTDLISTRQTEAWILTFGGGKLASEKGSCNWDAGQRVWFPPNLSRLVSGSSNTWKDTIRVTFLDFTHLFWDSLPLARCSLNRAHDLWQALLSYGWCRTRSSSLMPIAAIKSP